MSAPTLDQMWTAYWRERENGGDPPDRRLPAKDAYFAGAAAALLRANDAGRDEAWAEFRGNLTAELCSDMGPLVGLRKIDPPPAGYACS